MEAQIRTLVSLPDNFVTNTGWVDLIWSTDTPAPVLFSVYLLMDTYFFPFCLHCIILAVTNMHYTQRVISSFKSRNIDGRTPSFSGRNMDFVEKT